jgi:hypothetical protein
MNTVAEVRYALSHMSLEDRHSIACWLEGYQEHEPLFLEVREPAIKDAEEPMYMSEGSISSLRRTVPRDTSTSMATCMRCAGPAWLTIASCLVCTLLWQIVSGMAPVRHS